MRRDFSVAQPPRDEDYTIVNVIRVLVVMVLFVYLGTTQYTIPFLIIAADLGFAVLWLALEKWGVIRTPEMPYSTLIPTTIDIFAITIFVILTGTTSSILILGYYFVILLTSQNFRIPHGEFTAGLSFLAYSTAVVLVLSGVITTPNITGSETELRDVNAIGSIVFNGIGFLGLHRVTKLQVLQTNTLIAKLGKAEKELNRQNETVTLLLQGFETHSEDWQFELDEKLIIIYASDKIRTAEDFRLESGASFMESFRKAIPDDDREALSQLQSLQNCLDSGAAFRDAHLKIHPAGSPIWLSVSAAPSTSPRSDHVAWIGIGRDITEKKALESQLHRQAFFDERTGIFNRHGLYSEIDRHLATPEASFHGILGILRLANLDQIRTNLSSKRSDDVISAVVRSCRDHFDDQIVLARLDRNELGFWILSPDIDTIDSIHRFARNFDEPLSVDSDSFKLQVTIGIAFYPDDAPNRRDLFRAADLALNSIISMTTRKVVRYRDDLATRYLQRIHTVNAFHDALSRNEFTLLYQPQVDAMTRSITGAEALVRWNHPTRGLVSPAEFIPLAEQSGFIRALGNWIIGEACRQAAEWPQPLPVAINLSGIQLQNTREVNRIVTVALRSSGLSANLLVIEITESAMVAGENELKVLLSEFQQKGIQIALDDFGTGYSSLAYVQNLKLDKLKIDQSFVRRIGTGNNAEEMIRIILELSKIMGLTSVAEGVETEAQASFLQLTGCNTLQGYLFGKPLSQPDFVSRLA